METNASEDVVAVERDTPSAAITSSLPAAPLQSSPKIQEVRDAQVITRIRQRRQEALERIKKVGQQRRSATEEAVRGYQLPSEEKKKNRRDSSTGPRRTSPPPPAARSAPPPPGRPPRHSDSGHNSGNGGFTGGGGFLDEETQLAIALSMSAQEARGETATLPDEVVAAMMMADEVAQQERSRRAANEQRARAHNGGGGFGRSGIPHWMLAEDPIEGMMEEMTRSGSDPLYDSGGNAIDMSYENLVNLEDVPTPLSDAIKARIPTYALDAAGVELRQKEGTGDCPVCLMGYEDGDEVAMLPSCAHEFHKDCVFHWFESRNKCPVCRAGFDDM